MFHSISIFSKEEVANNKLRIVINVKDTCFKETVELIGPRVDDAYYEPVAIYQSYSNRKLNAVRNLAIYYVTMAEGYKYIFTDVKFFAQFFATINYNMQSAKLVKLYYDDLNILIEAYNKQEESNRYSIFGKPI
jgi:hypothetical protein